MPIEPYLFFEGRCDEALEFYRRALGAEVTSLMRYKESPEPPQPSSENKVMHANVRVGDASFMASDGNCSGKPKFEGFSLTLEAKDAAQAERWFAALAEGGEVRMPLGKTFFSPCFGMLADRFGVPWMIIVAAQ